MRITDTYSQLYIAELGATAFIIGGISAISIIILCLVRIPGGYVADRYGRKKIINFMTFAVALTTLIYAFAPSWEWYLFGTVLNNLFLIYQPALMAIRADSLAPQRRGLGFAIGDFLPNLISIPAPLVSIWLVSSYGLRIGMRYAYITSAILGVGAGIIRLFLKETLPQLPRKNKIESFKEIHEDFKKEYTDALKFVFKQLRSLAIFYVIFNFAFAGLSPLLSYYTVYHLGVSTGDWGIIFWTGNAVSLLLVIPIGFSLDKMGRKKVLFFIVSVSIIGFALLALTPQKAEFTFLIALISMTVVMLSSTAFMIATSALEADIIPRERRGRVGATLAIVSSLAMAAGQSLSGFLYQSFSPRLPFMITTVLLTVTVIVLAFFIKEPREKEQ